VPRKLKRSASERGFSLTELLIVLLVMGVVAAIAIPQTIAIVRNQRIRGDAHTLAGEISMAKMRAGSDFTQARLYLDLGANKFRVDVWVPTNVWDPTIGCWHPDDAVAGTCADNTPGSTAVALSSGVTAGFGSVGTPPPDTTAALAQASACTDNTRVAVIANTACIVFNSRGIPLNSLPAGLYITDTNTVSAVTVNASGMARTWSTSASGSGNWQPQ
jgi:prepilin-type N-terminal cleavage/methylation domain-containing protein